MSDKWILNHGIHRGTITSRDSGSPEEFDTREQALNQLAEHKKFYHRIGYVIWFAELTAPDGTKTTLEQNSNYR